MLLFQHPRLYFLKRLNVLQEIIEEITTYRIRLRRLIDDNENLANKDTLSPEDRDKLVQDTKIWKNG
jgi:hypothetical protein